MGHTHCWANYERWSSCRRHPAGLRRCSWALSHWMSRGTGLSLSHSQVHQGSSHCVLCHNWPLSNCPHPGAPESLRGAGFGGDFDAASGWHGSGGMDDAAMCSGAQHCDSCGEVGHGAHQGQDDNCSWCSISECGREGSHHKLRAGDRVPRGCGGNGVVGRRE